MKSLPGSSRRPTYTGRGALIGEAARRCVLTARAIRLYEQIGLVSFDRDDAGIRYFDQAALQRLEYIAEMRRAGLALKDIALLIETELAQGVAARDQLAMAICHEKLEGLDTARARLAEMIDSLRGAATSASRAA